MNKHLPLAILSVASAASAAPSYGVSYALSLDAATGNTRVDYVIAGSWISPEGQYLDVSPGFLVGFNFLGASVGANASVPATGSLGWSGTINGRSEVYTWAGSPSLTATNVETNATKSSTGFQLTGSNGNLMLGIAFGSGISNDYLPITNGQHVRISGDTSGSFVINKSFSFFNQGEWTTGAFSNVTIGPVAPVPEPSTYGLMLGGLALAAVAARRRKNSR